MQALSDDQRIDRLEGKVDGLDKKVDRLEVKMENGFAEVRAETRADFRTLLGVQLTTIVATIVGFAGLLLQHHL